MFEPIDDETENVAKEIVDSAFKVYTALGPGLLEPVYESCVCYELKKRNLAVDRQVTLPILYDSQKIENGLRIDILVEDKILVEVKAVNDTNPVFQAQLLTYLKLTKKRLGLLINFNVSLFKHGIKRIIL